MDYMPQSRNLPVAIIILFKGTVRQIEKALINNRLRVSTVF